MLGYSPCEIIISDGFAPAVSTLQIGQYDNNKSNNSDEKTEKTSRWKWRKKPRTKKSTSPIFLCLFPLMAKIDPSLPSVSLFVHQKIVIVRHIIHITSPLFVVTYALLLLLPPGLERLCLFPHSYRRLSVGASSSSSKTAIWFTKKISSVLFLFCGGGDALSLYQM